MKYKYVGNLLHVSAILRGIQERKMHSWLAITQTCNNTGKTQNIKWLKNLSSTECASNSYYLNCK